MGEKDERKATTRQPRKPKKPLSMREAALEVFRANGNQPLKAKELYAAMCALKNHKASTAPTPTATLGALLYTHPTIFEKVGKGLFRAQTQALEARS